MFAVESRVKECSLVERVRGLLADMRAGAADPADPRSRLRILQARLSGSGRLDVEEVYERLGRLRAAYPEIEGVEAGPLLSLAEEYFPPPGPRFAAPEGSD